MNDQFDISSVNALVGCLVLCVVAVGCVLGDGGRVHNVGFRGGGKGVVVLK